MSFTHPPMLPLPLPFPQVFSREVSARGAWPIAPGAAPRSEGVDVEACPTATQLHAAAQAGRCSSLQKMVSTVRAKRRSAWSSAVQARYSVEADDFNEVLEVLVEHLECGAADSDDDGGGYSD